MIHELPKRCIQCDHYREPNGDCGYHMCANPLLADIVTGGHTSCGFNRSDKDYCGPEGRLFSPREPLASNVTGMPAPGKAA